MYWNDLTRLELNELDKNIPVILPLAAIEQHGDHLPVSTDVLINEHFCKKLNDCIDNQVLIVSPIAVTCSGHHLDLGGTLSVSHQVLFSYIQEIIQSILYHGFMKIVLFNSHGGNQAIGQTVLESTGLLNPQAHIFMASWWKLAHNKLTQLNEAGFQGTGHACEFETSLIATIDETMIRKEKIQDTEMMPIPSWAQGDLLHAPSVNYHRTMKEFTGDGVFGKASYYSAEKGAKITEIVTGELSKIIFEIHQL